VIAGAALFHKVILRNYARLPVEVPLDFLFEVDFADVFEVRGFKRAGPGHHFEPMLGDDSLTFRYRGLDGVKRFTKIMFQPRPTELQVGHASFLITLKPGEQKEIEVQIIGGSEKTSVGNQTAAHFEDALAQRRFEIERLDARWARISASHQSLDQLLQRSAADLTSMIRFASEGTFLMAGVPWHATPFGRDSILVNAG
jgi:glycogen debranching enzyme